jgi:hypothetical protein
LADLATAARYDPIMLDRPRLADVCNVASESGPGESFLGTELYGVSKNAMIAIIAESGRAAFL